MTDPLFTITRDFTLTGRRQGAVVLKPGILGFGRDVREATIFTLKAPSGLVEVARIDRQDFDYNRTLVMPAEEGGASAVDCLLVEQELPRLGRELFLDRPSPDPTPIPSVDTMLDGLAQDFQGATDG